MNMNPRFTKIEVLVDKLFTHQHDLHGRLRYLLFLLKSNSRAINNNILITKLITNFVINFKTYNGLTNTDEYQLRFFITSLSNSFESDLRWTICEALSKDFIYTFV